MIQSTRHNAGECNLGSYNKRNHAHKNDDIMRVCLVVMVIKLENK